MVVSKSNSYVSGGHLLDRSILELVEFLFVFVCRKRISENRQRARDKSNKILVHLDSGRFPPTDESVGSHSQSLLDFAEAEERKTTRRPVS